MWFNDAKECVVGVGEVLIARSNTADLVGRVAVFPGSDEEVVASDLTVRLLPTDERITSTFLGAYLSYLYLTGYWKVRAGGASDSMKKITRVQIQGLAIPVPSLGEQQRIHLALSEKMTATEHLSAALEAQLTAIKHLPTAILRRAFAGAL